MVRIEPFATLGRELQKGKFDCPDRLFYNIVSTWSSINNSTSDVKELIPEFYYFPDFFRNM